MSIVNSHMPPRVMCYNRYEWDMDRHVMYYVELVDVHYIVPTTKIRDKRVSED